MATRRIITAPTFSRSLRATTLSLAAASRAANTLVAYRQAWKTFTDWCRKKHAPRLPTTPEIVATFVADLVAHGRRPATAEIHVAAVAYFHREAGQQSPVDPSVHQVIRGAKRLNPELRGKEALTVNHLRRIVATIAPTTRGLRDRAILLFGFATALRRSNLAALDLDDIRFRRQGVVVRVQREKQNQTGEPRWIGVFASRSRFCPVKALSAWLKARGSAPGALFCQVFSGRVRPDLRLAGRRFSRIVKRCARAIGLDPSRYGAHSLRAGFVTAAAEAGVSPLVIMQTSGHRSMSTLQRYFRPASIFNVNPLAGVL